MSREIVRYDNELNQISFRDWNGLEQDLFFAIITKMQGKGTQEVVFDTEDLRDFIEFSATANKRWDAVLTRASLKVVKLTYIEQHDGVIDIMNLFQRFRLDTNARTLTVKVADDYEYIINKLQAHFTQFELEEFGHLKSTYSKTMYRLLKQWRLVGRREFGIEEFRAYLGVPKSYDGRKITQKVIRPIMDELPEYFEGLKLETLRGRGRGHPIQGYVFTWKAEPKHQGEWVEGKYDNLQRPESAKAKAKRRAEEEQERARLNQERAVERVEAKRRAEQAKAETAKAREAHGGSMFAGSKNYKPAPNGGLVASPLFEDGGEA